MEFRLLYQGALKGKGARDDKQHLRRFLHPQLRALWKQKPLDDYAEFLPGGKHAHDSPFVRSVGGFTSVPLVVERAHLIAELDVTLLRPEPPGSVLTQSGDIDNRLKTLFDALRMPKSTDELPDHDSPEADESPFFCLLEDDNLITHVAVTTDRLLVPTSDPLEVVTLLHVRLKVTRATIDFFALGI